MAVAGVDVASVTVVAGQLVQAAAHRPVRCQRPHGSRRMLTMNAHGHGHGSGHARQRVEEVRFTATAGHTQQDRVAGPELGEAAVGAQLRQHRGQGFGGVVVLEEVPNRVAVDRPDAVPGGPDAGDGVGAGGVGCGSWGRSSRGSV